jgi:hypothetical protein
MVMNELRKLYAFSKLAQNRRKSLVDWRWRVVVFCAVLVLFAYTVWYAQFHYPTWIDTVPGKAPFFLNDRLLEWFTYGFFAGFFTFVLLSEGEFLLALRKITRELGEEFGSAERALGEFQRGGVARVSRPRKGRKGRRA